MFWVLVLFRSILLCGLFDGIIGKQFLCFFIRQLKIIGLLCVIIFMIVLFRLFGLEYRMFLVLKVLVSLMKLGRVLDQLWLQCLLCKSFCYWCIMFRCLLFRMNCFIGKWNCIVVFIFCMFISYEVLFVMLIISVLGCVSCMLIEVGKLQFMVFRLFEVIQWFGLLNVRYCVVYIWCWFILVVMQWLYFLVSFLRCIKVCCGLMVLFFCLKFRYLMVCYWLICVCYFVIVFLLVLWLWDFQILRMFFSM